jgi:hypothetical protein
VIKDFSVTRFFPIFVLFVVLTGCASTHMNRGLQALIGKDIETAFSVLGYPNEEHKYGDENVYIWNKRSPIAYYNPISQEIVGTGSPGGLPANSNCTIRIVSDSRGIINNNGWFGMDQACRSYAGKLHNYYKQFE